MGRAKPNPAPTRHEPGDDGFRIDYAEGGARSRNRTDKSSRMRDFKSPAFTSFAIRAASRRRAVGASVSRNSWQRNPLRNPAFRAPAGFPGTCPKGLWPGLRSEEHTSELQSLMRISYAVFCLKKKNKKRDLKQ